MSTENNTILRSGEPLLPVGICAVFTLLFSGYTFITIMLFEKLRAKFFMRAVAFISLNDFFANVVFFVNMHDPSQCALQGIVQSYCYISSVLWAAVLTYLVDKLLKYGRVELSKSALRNFHIICWGYPLFASLFPLIQMKYVYKNEPYKYNCILTPKYHENEYYSKTPSEIGWNLVAFSGVILIAISYMYWTCLWIVYKLYNLKTLNRDAIKTVVGNLFLYPIAMAIAWIPYIFYLYFADIFDIKHQVPKKAIIFSDCLTVLNGAFTGLVFWYTSKDGSTCWKRLLKYRDASVINDNFESKFMQNSGTSSASSVVFSNFEDYYVDEASSYGNTGRSTSKIVSSANPLDDDNFDYSNNSNSNNDSNNNNNNKTNNNDSVVNIEVLDNSMRRQNDFMDEIAVKNRNRSHTADGDNNTSPLYNTLL